MPQAKANSALEQSSNTNNDLYKLLYNLLYKLLLIIDESTRQFNIFLISSITYNIPLRRATTSSIAAPIAKYIRNSIQYKQTCKKASIDIKNFSKVRKLVRLTNYNNQYNDFTIAYRQASIINFFYSEEDVSITLEDPKALSI